MSSEDLKASFINKPQHVQRTGSIWTGVAHVITAVIGAGVLSLAWSICQIGWIGGPIAILVCAAITLIQSNLLADCYIQNQHGMGPSYSQAVLFYLGHRSYIVCVILQHISFFGAGIAYVITSADSIRAIKQSNCYHKEGHQASCSYGVDVYMLLFGAVEIFVSQIPDFHSMACLSIVAAIMSFCYAFIGFGLGLAKVIENGAIKGSIGGIAMASTSQKIWRISQAMGDIAFAYPYSLVLFEIQDTLRSPPPQNESMKRVNTISISTTTLFYLACGCLGYAAFGDDTPGNILTGFGFYEPYWLVDFANACVVIHLIGGYQVYSQPLFAFFERWLAERFPDSVFINRFYAITLPFLPTHRVNLCSLCIRTLYVVTTIGVAMFFPYFNQVLGVLGSFGFWPLAIYFPVQMYLIRRKIRAWTTKWVALNTFSIGCLLASIFALIGSIEGLINEKLS